ncbi:aquaporin [Planoprotostelium fungivorum]|uniref:Aquaporin n=1 Tax=Planoprotostelium fungivorum TaxID=1890364 RepID=A0A2P6NI43_9EUKA|nr:aquaporin [Planoprotostelium fungivorum]
MSHALSYGSEKESLLKSYIPISVNTEETPSDGEKKIRRFSCRLSDLASWENLWKAILGEFIGTFIMMYVGLGAILAQDELLYVALTWSLIMPVLISIFGKISQALFNPAITVVFWLLEDITLLQAIFSVFAQLLGSAAASALQLQLWPLDTRKPYYDGCTFNVPIGDKSGTQRGLINEVVTTCILVFLLLSLTHRGPTAELQHPQTLLVAMAVGATIFCMVMVGAPISGASLNPARSFGPSLVANYWDDHWVFWAGPIIGALLGMSIWYTFVRKVYITEEKKDS